MKQKLYTVCKSPKHYNIIGNILGISINCFGTVSLIVQQYTLLATAALSLTLA